MALLEPAHWHAPSLLYFSDLVIVSVIRRHFPAFKYTSTTNQACQGPPVPFGPDALLAYGIAAHTGTCA
jgi:hypothetical protein